MNQSGDRFNPFEFNLKDHGDSQEEEFSTFLRDHIGEYQRFWRRFVVPLSFRILDRDHPFIRPSIPEQCEGLVNASYAVMWHITWAYKNKRELQQTRREDRIKRTRLLYTFLCHTRSFCDAVAAFGGAVDAIPNSARPFNSRQKNTNSTDNTQTWFLDYPTPSFEPCYRLFKSLLQEVSSYRNQVIHECPIYVINDRIPNRGSIREYSGLTAVGRAVRTGNVGFPVKHMWLSNWLDNVFDLACRTANEMWRVAYRELDPILNVEYLRSVNLEEDRHLTKDRFDRFFEDFGDSDI
jgi:hypothetical protein